MTRAQSGATKGHVDARFENQVSTKQLVSELKQCGKRKDLQRGKLLHYKAIECGCQRNTYVASTLISMYSKCRDMLQARRVFDDMNYRDVISWTALIVGYVENGESFVALEVFQNMDCAPDRVTFIAVLKACAGLATKLEKKICLQEGLRIHRRATDLGFEKDIVVANTLVDMYSKCGDMLQARSVFDEITHRDVVSWNVLIFGYVENGGSSMALEMFYSMDCAPDHLTFVAALKACAGIRLQEGVRVHRQAREFGFDKHALVENTLVDMYRKCRDMVRARRVFDGMKHRDVVSWNVLLFGYVENGQNSMALDVFNSMDCGPDRSTFTAALKACNKLENGLSVHKQARKLGFEKDGSVANMLVDMYGKCGDMARARSVFDGMTYRDSVSWNVLILGYVGNGLSLIALDVFNSMDCKPDSVTFVAALKACGELATGKEIRLQKAVSLYKQARELGFDKDLVFANTLVDIYGKCGDMLQAREFFDGMIVRDVVSWNVLILGYVENGESSVAFDVFNRMDCQADSVTFVAALKACVGLNKLVSVHKQVRERGFEKDIVVASTLVDMYSKCGDMLSARCVFDGMVERDVVSWNTLILGYVDNGQSSVALDMFNSMDCAASGVTYVAAIKACACLGALETGRVIHDRVSKLGFEREQVVANCLVDFYAKCGSMAAAEDVFRRMRARDTVSWNALIGGYSSLGDAPQVFRMVERMHEEGYGVEMNSVTFLLLLTACNHAGMVEEGQRYFETMSRYGIEPTVEHYACMVDMLGRANRLKEALLLVRRMPFVADSVVWTALLGACKKWSNVEIGKVAFGALVALNEDKASVAAAHVLMRKIFEKSY